MKTKILNFFGGWFGLGVCITSWIIVDAMYLGGFIGWGTALFLVFVVYNDHQKHLRHNELKQLCHTEEDFQKLREENEKLKEQIK
jgi:hypothetical protein